MGIRSPSISQPSKGHATRRNRAARGAGCRIWPRWQARGKGGCLPARAHAQEKCPGGNCKKNAQQHRCSLSNQAAIGKPCIAKRNGYAKSTAPPKGGAVHSLPTSPHRMGEGSMAKTLTGFGERLKQPDAAALLPNRRTAAKGDGASGNHTWWQLLGGWRCAPCAPKAGVRPGAPACPRCPTPA